MVTKEAILRKAQHDANRTGETMVVLNLNPYSPLYVIRGAECAALKSVVAVCHPQKES